MEFSFSRYFSKIPGSIFFLSRTGEIITQLDKRSTAEEKQIFYQQLAENQRLVLADGPSLVFYRIADYRYDQPQLFPERFRLTIYEVPKPEELRQTLMTSSSYLEGTAPVSQWLKLLQEQFFPNEPLREVRRDPYIFVQMYSGQELPRREAVLRVFDTLKVTYEAE